MDDATPDDHVPIRRLIDEATEHQSDVEPFLALHTADVALVNIAGRRVLGKDVLREAMSTALASPMAKVLTAVDVEDIRFVRPDVAIVSCVKHVTDERDGGESLPVAGSLTYVVVEEDGTWLIASAQTTPIVT